MTKLLRTGTDHHHSHRVIELDCDDHQAWHVYAQRCSKCKHRRSNAPWSSYWDLLAKMRWQRLHRCIPNPSCAHLHKNICTSRQPENDTDDRWYLWSSTDVSHEAAGHEQVVMMLQWYHNSNKGSQGNNQARNCSFKNERDAMFHAPRCKSKQDLQPKVR